MARYIDAEKFLKDETKRCGSVPLVGTCTTDNESLAYQLAKAPTADVEEVKHGMWIETKEWYFDEYAQSDYQRKCYECSICKRTELHKELYCHCGAKMDGENVSDTSDEDLHKCTGHLFRQVKIKRKWNE